MNSQRNIINQISRKVLFNDNDWSLEDKNQNRHNIFSNRSIKPQKQSLSKYNKRLKSEIYKILKDTPQVIEVKTDFELDLTSTVRCAFELGIDHPKIKGTDEYQVMKTDFLVTLKVSGIIHQVPVHVKSSNSRESKRNNNYMEIEDYYWFNNRLDLIVLTKDFVQNPPKELISKKTLVGRQISKRII